MMPVADALEQRFPSAPTKAGEWAPVYLEPIVGSGERLTVLVVSRVDATEYSLLRTLDTQRAKCMYGDHAVALNGLIDLIAESLHELLARGMSLQDWVPPLRDSVALGPVSSAFGDTADEIARSGAMLTASLSVFMPKEPVVMGDEVRADDDGDEWERQIREDTVRLRQQFAPRFSRRIELRRGAPSTRIGYLGDRLAAQFGRLIPGRGLTNSRNRAKAYVTDLQILRDQDSDGLVGIRPHYELMLWVPPDGSPAYSQVQRDEARGAFTELEAFGDKHALRVEALHESAEAVRRILHAEESIS